MYVTAEFSYRDLGQLSVLMDRLGTATFKLGENEVTEEIIKTLFSYGEKDGKWVYSNGNVEFNKGGVLDDYSDVEVNISGERKCRGGLHGTEYAYYVKMSVPREAVFID